MKDTSAGPRGHPILVHHAFGVNVGKAALPARTSTRSSDAPGTRDSFKLRSGVVTFAQSFGAVLVGGSETIVRLAT